MLLPGDDDGRKMVKPRENRRKLNLEARELRGTSRSC